MIGAIAAIIIVIWYYRSALESNKNPVTAAAIGFLAYLVPAIIWTIAVTPGLRDSVEHDPGLFLGLIVRYGFIIVGVACAAWVKPRHLAIKKSK